MDALNHHAGLGSAIALSFLFHVGVFWALGVYDFQALEDGVRSASATHAQLESPVVLQARLDPRGDTERGGRSPDPGPVPEVPALRATAAVTPARDSQGGTIDKGVAGAAASSTGADAARVLPQTQYHDLSELTTKPRVISDPGSSRITYIPDLHPLPVVVDILIGEGGDVDKVVLGENFLSDTAKAYIVDSVSNMKFRPGMIGARPVRSRWQIQVSLDPAKPGN